MRPPPCPAVFTAQALRSGLIAAGQSLTTELFPAIHLPGGSIIAGRFDPVWTFDPTPPGPPPPSPPKVIPFPLQNDGFVSELKGSKVPAGLQLPPVSFTSVLRCAASSR